MPPLRPFPFPSLSIGTDIAHVPRIARLVASQRTLPRFLRKVFTSREERDFHLRFPKQPQKSLESLGASRQDSDGPWVAETARFLAGRWAAKEAIVKACSWRKLTFDEIQVLKEPGGKRIYGVVLDQPDVRQTDKQPPSSAHVTGAGSEDAAGQIVQISISHDGEYATAVCLAAKESNE